jgi:hypothetical protein
MCIMKTDNETNAIIIKRLADLGCLAILSALLTIPTLAQVAQTNRPEAAAPAAPAWLGSGQPVAAKKVSTNDYAFLAQWLDQNAVPAQDYLIGLFKQHQVVIIGEEHNVKEHKDFVNDLVPKLYQAGVRCIGWEFSRHSRDARLQQLITAPRYDAEAVLQFAREASPDWNSKEHWDLIQAVWNLNRSLPPGSEGMRMIGLEPDIDIAQYWIVAGTKPVDSPEFQKMIDDTIRGDQAMAEYAAAGIFEKGFKGLLFMGMGHDWTQYSYPPPKSPWDGLTKSWANT